MNYGVVSQEQLEKIDEILRKITQAQIERQALLKEKDKASRERLEKLEIDIAVMKEEVGPLKLRWDSEKQMIHEISAVREDIDRYQTQAQQAERNGDLAKVAQIRYGTIEKLLKDLKVKKEALNDLQQDVTVASGDLVFPGDLAGRSATVRLVELYCDIAVAHRIIESDAFLEFANTAAVVALDVRADRFSQAPGPEVVPVVSMVRCRQGVRADGGGSSDGPARCK